ncbi:hypothetical protein O9992_25910 [Vibrio lentus]|nr:hypothetical protein [Vibrio lentus]
MGKPSLHAPDLRDPPFNQDYWGTCSVKSVGLDELFEDVGASARSGEIGQQNLRFVEKVVQGKMALSFWCRYSICSIMRLPPNK